LFISGVNDNVGNDREEIVRSGLDELFGTGFETVFEELR
jgi:hypothetical protein